jgi:hypothetical protein
MKRAFLIIPLMLLAALVTMGPSYDDVSDVDGIKERLSKLRVMYKEDHPAIQRMLRHLEKAEAQKADQKIKKAQGRALAKAFPQAPQGWHALKPRGTEPAPSGGQAINASRVYLNRGGGKVKIVFQSDSGEAQALNRQLQDPTFKQAYGQARLINFQGQKALLINQSIYQMAELRALIHDFLLLKVTARNVPGAAKVVREFADNVDLATIRKLAE